MWIVDKRKGEVNEFDMPATTPTGNASRSDDDWRSEAWRVLNRIESDRAFAARMAEHVRHSGHERGRLMDVVSGVTRQRRWLDFLIDSFLRNKNTHLEQGVRQALRMGTYELLFSGQAPYAAVDQTVELVKREVRPRAAGLANGLLRNMVRRINRLPKPQHPDAAVRMAIRHSHPDWMVRRWTERFSPDELERLLRHNNSRPGYTVRFNTLHHSIEETKRALKSVADEWQPSILFEDCIRTTRLSAVLGSGLFKEGRLAIQDEAAMAVVRWLDPGPGYHLLKAGRLSV